MCLTKPMQHYIELETSSIPIVPDDEAWLEEGRVWVRFQGTSDYRLVGVLSSLEKVPCVTCRLQICSSGNAYRVPVKLLQANQTPIPNFRKTSTHQIEE